MKMKKNKFHFEWFNNWEEILDASFIERWDETYKSSINRDVFQEPQLNLAWIKTYLPIRTIKPIFCIAKYGDVFFFWPLIKWHQNYKNAFLKKIIPVGYSDFDYHDPLTNCESENLYSEFIEELIAEISKNYQFDKIELNGLKTKFNHKNLILEKEFCPYLNFSSINTEDELFLKLSTKLRGDIKRQIKKIEDNGKLELIALSNIEDININLNTFLDLHSKKWPNSYKAPKFHINLIENGLKCKRLHFSILKCGKEIISWHLGFIDNTTLYYYMPIINDKWKNYSPGKIHLFFLNKFAIENKLLIFDHLRGEENYKNGWTNEKKKLYILEIYSQNILSKIKISINKLKNRLY